MEKPLHHYPLAWIIALLPYKLGFLCVIFGDATIAQALFWGTLAYPLIAFVATIFKSPFAFILSLFIAAKI